MKKSLDLQSEMHAEIAKVIARYWTPLKHSLAREGCQMDKMVMVCTHPGIVHISVSHSQAPEQEGPWDPRDIGWA
jgi:hypothetical protein